MRASDRVAVVTGAGAGIGQAIARRLASEGATVVCGDRDGAAAEATARGMTVPPQGRRAPHFIGLRRSEPFPPGLIATLAARGAHVALRGGAIRVSPYLYNTEADVEQFFAILDEALAA